MLLLMIMALLLLLLLPLTCRARRNHHPGPILNLSTTQVRVTTLRGGTSYLARVTATNGAGLNTSVQGLPIVVERTA